MCKAKRFPPPHLRLVHGGCGGSFGSEGASSQQGARFQRSSFPMRRAGLCTPAEPPAPAPQRRPARSARVSSARRWFHND